MAAIYEFIIIFALRFASSWNVKSSKQDRFQYEMIEEYIIKTVKRLRKEAPRRFKDLKQACDQLIGMKARDILSNV